MPLIAPARDPHFAVNKFHGELAQTRKLWLAASCCKTRRTAVDIGAHIGTWSRELARLFKDVWAFEPCAENFTCLKANAPKKVHLENVALGSHPGRCDMNLPPEGNSGMWHVVPGDKVEVRTLDSYELKDVDFIKIDAEGYEGDILQGALRTIRTSRPVVVFEDNGLGEKYYGFLWSDPKLILEEEGYEQRHKANRDLVWAPKC